MKKTLFILFLVYSLILLSCASYKLEKSADLESKEFYSKVRYIITNKERTAFRNLPPSERKNFIEEFWEKRDPDTDTEINEFKEEYFNRIEEANLLFKEGSTPGWLQERGRVFITLGPPDTRRTYPRGTSLYGIPTEIWYYGFFPVVFIDENWTGNYKLDPLSAQHIAEINKTQVDYRPKVPMEKVIFDFNLNTEKGKEGEALFRVEIPFRNIWLTEKENLLQTTLEVSMEVLNQDEKSIWQYKENYEVSLTEENLIELIDKKYLIKVSANIQPGKYILVVEIENRSGGTPVRKRAEFSI